jgi:hypothetical protein
VARLMAPNTPLVAAEFALRGRRGACTENLFETERRRKRLINLVLLL